MRKTKDLLSKRKEKIIKLPVSKFIDTRFREYAVYVLEARGIPSYYDALTPVQRFILKNSPASFNKTLSVVGRAIEDGYHHGNCLSYDTKINLGDGTQITIGEWFDKSPDAVKIVKSKDEDGFIWGVGHSPRIGQETDEYFEIELENSEIIKCTENHPFFVNGKWVEAKDLKENDELFSLIKNLIIKSIKRIKLDYKEKFYDITVNEYHNFSIGDSNIIVHNSSLEGSISKLARPFGNALQILEGYGFFGSEVSPDPAAARYTSVKLSPKANEILGKYKHLTTREPDGPYHPFWLDVPIGLTIPIIGIAVGYKTTVLPRKLEHIKEFLEGTRKSLKPYFEGFTGDIKKFNSLENSWLLTSVIEIDGKHIIIKDIPPILKYIAVLKKLDGLLNKFENVRIVNNSNTKVDIEVVYTGKSQQEWDELQSYVTKIFSIVVTEAPVFIKDGQVLVYNNVEEYVSDYRWQVKRLLYYNTLYENNRLKFDLNFSNAKKEFIEFMLAKKRSNEEIDSFFKTNKWEKDICDKLERMTARKFTRDELTATTNEIKELTGLLKLKTKQLAECKLDYEKTEDPTLKRGIGSKKSTIDLFETTDIEEIDGIMIWRGEDPFDVPSQAEDTFAEEPANLEEDD